MKKGKFGIYIWFYAVMGFVFAITGQVLPTVLTLGFVIAAEQDNWAVKQVMQALFLCIANSVLSTILDAFNVFRYIPVLGGVISGILGTISGIISLILLIIGLMAITRVIKGEDANTPIFSKWVDRAFGFITQRIVVAQTQDSEEKTGDTDN